MLSLRVWIGYRETGTAFPPALALPDKACRAGVAAAKTALGTAYLASAEFKRQRRRMGAPLILGVRDASPYPISGQPMTTPERVNFLQMHGCAPYLPAGPIARDKVAVSEGMSRSPAAMAPCLSVERVTC